MKRIVTLITDFGWDDGYAGAVKGAILSVNPDVTIVDITHGIPPHSILDAALCLRSVFSFFPPRTVHLVVVDPGVGGERRGLLVTSEHHLFVGPDNGVFTFAREDLETSACYDLTAAHYFSREISPTFHARDIFGPVAGWLTKGIAPENFGAPVNDPVRLRLPQPVLGRGGSTGTSSASTGSATCSPPSGKTRCARSSTAGPPVAWWARIPRPCPWGAATSMWTRVTSWP